ncbi:TPD1 protein homolog 1A [Cajanus cajan]|uniref:Uncharacterized protein n=1 Tax=Cajanus cajan TaxID=3821 RepID=A0A151SFS8_CAJCA|nr:TPD1 protein homolog 1A [Cajanus cajan]KYP53647.1 hypothetical protein KK1_024542 [Cajanus cajan]
MAAAFVHIVSILFLTMIIKGSCECSLNNINIGTTRSGREIQGKPEWNVTVINNCSCVQSQIKLACKGFQSAETIDPSIFSVEGDTCLLNKGNPVKGFDAVSFSYAWDPPFLLLPTSSVIVGPCS